MDYRFPTACWQYEAQHVLAKRPRNPEGFLENQKMIRSNQCHFCRKNFERN